MAVANGYGKTVTSGSVFMYDTGDDINSFKGQPKANLLTTISKAGTNDSTYFKTNSGTETKFVSNVGVREVHYVNILNDYYGGSGNCCPAPMHFGDFTISPATTYTYQIIYRTTTGYVHPNYMYHYEFNNGTYVTEYGLWDSSRETDLGDGWKHAWGTFTSNASANRFITYLFHYEYGVWNKIEVAGVMLTQGSNIIPPRQFIPLATTRSATQGLLPLVSNTSIDLSNISFDTNAQMYFDGTDDYVDLGYAPFSGTGDFTIDTVYTLDTVDTHTIIGNYPASSLQFMGRYGLYINGACYFPSSLGAGTYHAAATRESGVCKLYLNGALVNTVSNSNSIGTNSFVMGKNTVGTERLTGKVPVMKLYNRALSAAEVNQNYNKYKSRFNLS